MGMPDLARCRLVRLAGQPMIPRIALAAMIAGVSLIGARVTTPEPRWHDYTCIFTADATPGVSFGDGMTLISPGEPDAFLWTLCRDTGGERYLDGKRM